MPDQKENGEDQQESVIFTVMVRIMILLAVFIISPMILISDCNASNGADTPDMIPLPPFPDGTGRIPAPTAKFKTTREACEYYAQLAPGGPMRMVKADWAEKQVEWCLQLMKEKDFANNKRYIELPNMLSFILTKRFKKFVKHTGRKAKDVRISSLAPVINPKTGKPARLWEWQYLNKKPVTSLWYEEYCYLIKEDAEKVTQANAAMYSETKNMFRFKWCFRPPEQQAIMWARTCLSGSSKKNCRKTNPKATQVGRPGGSWHQLSGFDVSNPAQSVKYLNEAGFIGYCDSNVKALRDGDKGHFYPGNALQIKNLEDVWNNKLKLAKKKICEAKVWVGF